MLGGETVAQGPHQGRRSQQWAGSAAWEDRDGDIWWGTTKLSERLTGLAEKTRTLALKQ